MSEEWFCDNVGLRRFSEQLHALCEFVGNGHCGMLVGWLEKEEGWMVRERGRLCIKYIVADHGALNPPIVLLLRVVNSRV